MLNVIALIDFADISLFMNYCKVAHTLCVVKNKFNLLSVHTTLRQVTIRLHVSAELFSHHHT